MKKLAFILLITHLSIITAAPWTPHYQTLLEEKLTQREFTPPEGKILLFGYGSLMNRTSAARTIRPEAVDSMQPAIGFGFKRLFNYDVATGGGAMLNLEQTQDSHPLNGVLMEIDAEDLERLIEREVGYELVPIPVAEWQTVMEEDPAVQIRIAYTFAVPPKEIQAKIYPNRRYLSLVREGAARFGKEFLDYWNETTYLEDGTTLIKYLDKKL